MKVNMPKNKLEVVPSTIPGHQADLWHRWFSKTPHDAYGREITPGMIIMKPASTNIPPELLKVSHRTGDKIYVEGKRACIALPGRCIIVTDSIPEFVTGHAE